MKHRPWNPKTFFRELTPEVKKMLGEKFGVRLIAEPGDEAPDPGYRAWVKLPEPIRQRMEVGLGPVNDLCGKHARAYLEDLSKAVWPEDVREQSRDWSAQDLAVRLFLFAPAEFVRCHQRYVVDILDHFTEYRGKHPAKVEASPWAKKAMAERMATYFREQAGGARCQVEDYESTDKFALFIRHEDEVTPTERFDEHNQIVPVWQRPIAQAAAVFFPEQCTLLVKAPKKPDREMLRDAFAEIFIRERDYFEDVTAVPKFNFAPLRRIDMAFTTKFADRIDEVSVVKLVVKAPHRDVKRLIFEFTPGLSMEGVLVRLEERSLSLQDVDIDGVQLLFSFADGVGRGRQRTASLYRPNRSNLNDTPRDRVIRRYLKEWGIDASPSAFALEAPPPRAA